MPTPAEYAALVTAHAAQATAAVKAAAVYKERLDAAPKPAAPEAVKAAAEALVAGGWIKAAQLDQAATALANPQTAVETLTNLAKKSAAEITRLSGKDRLEGGEVVDPTKAASELKPGDPGYADQWFEQRRQQYRRA
jgi:hypothetical protein